MIKISKGLDLPISGIPDPVLSDMPKVTTVSLLGNDFTGMKPTMLVKPGDIVKRGTKIFEDKKNPGVFFTSPAGGIVKEISRGERRKFLSIDIEIADNEDHVEFDTNENTRNLLINSGLWNAFRSRPFNRTPSIDSSPNAIFINACDTNPLAVDPYFIIKEDLNYFNRGLKALYENFSCPIHCCYQNADFDLSVDGINYHQFSGPHPSGLTSTHINKIYPVNLKRIAWTIGYQDVISIGYLLEHAFLRTHKLIALGGPSVFSPSLIKARISGNIDELTAGKLETGSRVISGSVLYGHASEGVMNYLGFYDSLISAIPDQANDIFLNWLMPGSKLHSKLNVFISSFLKPSNFIFNTSVNGGDREQAVDLGMLELAPEDLAVCSYICPSKYDYCSILANNLNELYLEQ